MLYAKAHIVMCVHELSSEINFETKFLQLGRGYLFVLHVRLKYNFTE
jgi:hypothetical protein